MIIEAIISPLFLLVRGVLSVIPVLNYIPSSVADTVTLLVKALYFFPSDVWIACITSFLLWTEIHLVFAFINFVICYIPFVNMGR